MNVWKLLLRRGPSEDLEEAQCARRDVTAQREEVEKITTSLRDNVRKPNGLALTPLKRMLQDGRGEISGDQLTTLVARMVRQTKRMEKLIDELKRG